MAGFWSGFGTGFSEGLDREERRRQFDETIMQRRKAAILPDLRKVREKQQAEKMKLNSLATRLRGYGLEDEVVLSVIGTGDTESIERFVSTMDKQYETAQQAGRGEQYFETVNTTLSNAIMSPQGTTTLQGEDLAEYLGASLDEFGIQDDMGLDITTPGEFGYRPPVYTESRDIDDYTKLEKRIAENVRLTANSENNKLNRQISAITKRLESSNLSGEEEATLMEDRSALLARKQTIGQALDSYSGEEKDAFPLLSIYGTDAVGKVTSDFERFDQNKLLPNLTESIGKAPIAVTSAEQAQRFVQMGILNEGDSVLINGNVVTIQFEG